MSDTTNTTNTTNTNLNLSSPWVIYARKIQALFSPDPDIHLEFIDDKCELRLYVESQSKAEALMEILPMEVAFGNVTLKIMVVPADNAIKSKISLFKKAFDGNPIVDHITTVTDPAEFGVGSSYISFKKEVVQFFNDDLTDENRVCSTLYQDIAADIFGEIEDIHFCTAVTPEDKKNVEAVMCSMEALG